MADASIIISADTKALMRSLSAVVDELREVKDAVSAGAEAMGDSFGEAARQVEAAGEAVAKTTAGIGDQLSEQTKMAKALGEEQTKAVKALGEEQSKAARAIASALENQSRQQKDANAALSEQKELLAKQEKEIGKVTAAVEKNGSAWKLALEGFAIKAASEALDLLGRIASTGLESARVYEDMTASLAPLTGGIEEARDTFWSLNALEDETVTSTGELAQAFIDLGNNGLNNSNEQLRRYAAIAQGTGQDLGTLTRAVISFTQGSYESMRQFGITAKDNGDTVGVTFRGVTQEIEKNSLALERYLGDIAGNNFDGVLEAKLNTVSAASGRLENAWGTLCTRIMQSDGGLGAVVALGEDFLAGTLNGISDWLDNPEITEFFRQLGQTTKESFDAIKSGWDSVKDKIGTALDLMGLDMEEGANSWIQHFAQFFNFAREQFLGLSRMTGKIWDSTGGVLNAVGEGIGTFLSGGNFGKGYAAARKQTEKQAEANAKIYQQTMDSYLKDSYEAMSRIAEERAKIAARLAGNPPGEGTQSGEGVAFAGGAGGPAGVSRGSVGSSASRGGSYGANSVARELERAQTQARELYDRLTQDLNDGEAAALENDLARLNDYYSRRLLTDEQYQEARKALEADAAAFLTSLNPREAELQRIRDEYDAKLELLREYHEKQLISEQEFRQGLANISAGYYDRAGKADGKGAEGGGKENKNDFFNDKELKNIDEMEKGLSSLSSTISGMTSNLDESRAAYKAMFAAQKSFAMASATLNAIVAWTAALSDNEDLSWYGKLAKYAQAVALTGNILSQLASVTMHDKGGRIGPGALGIVGEYGPELVRGPAAVTSRKDTADLLAGTGRGVSVQVNLIEDSSRAGAVDTREDDEQTVIDICVANIRRGGALADAMANTYNLARVGM